MSDIKVQAQELFEIIDVYDSNAYNDLKQLVNITTGDAHDKAVKVLDAYTKYLHELDDAFLTIYETSEPRGRIY